MLQIFKYNLKQLLHNRSELFWVILFPIILGSLFKAAFSNITAGEKFQAIPVAIVNEQGSMSDGFMETVKELDKDDKDRFLKAVYCDKKQALSLLKKEKVDGIIQVDDNISLTVSSDMSSAKLNQSILSAFIEEYQMNYQAIVKIVKTHPEKLSEAMDILQESASYNQEISYGKNVDTYDQYYQVYKSAPEQFTSMYGGTLDMDKVTDAYKELYDKNGGNTHLDGAYSTAGTGHTVFAQVFDGMDVVRSIMGVETDSNDKPLEDVTILSAEIVPYE